MGDLRDLLVVTPPKVEGDYVDLALEDNGTDGFSRPAVLLTTDEVEQLIDELEAAIDPERFTSFVRIRFSGDSYTDYTYRDPSGELKIGDRVLAPFGGANVERSGKVVGFGRGKWTGPVKDVAARLLVEELTEAA